MTPTVPGLGDLLALFSLGGPVFALLFVLSIFATALVLRKIVQFARMRVGRHEVADRAVALWIADDAAGALQLAESDRSPVALAVAHAIRGSLDETADGGMVREDVDRVAGEILDRLQMNLRVFDAIVQIAPLLGLFGTVIGMIQTFEGMQQAGGAVDPSDLAGGIWVALLTTAFGLAIAMPVSAVSVWFDGRIDHERAAMESLLTSVFTLRATERPPEGGRSVREIEAFQA